MKKKVLILLLIPIFLFMSFNMGAGGVKNVIDENSCSSLYLLPDSVKELVSNRKYMIYDYGHHGSRWCLIYEEGGSFIFKIGSTRNERPNLISQIDTDRLIRTSASQCSTTRSVVNFLARCGTNMRGGSG